MSVCVVAIPVSQRISLSVRGSDIALSRSEAESIVRLLSYILSTFPTQAQVDAMRERVSSTYCDES